MLAIGGSGNIGDGPGEMGNALTPIDFGTSYAVSLDIGYLHGCALLANGAVKCWGTNNYGEVGVNGAIQTAAQLGANWPSVDLGSGRTARAITTGNYHTCAILDTYAVACWGQGTFGQLGYGNNANRYYQDLGNALTTVNLGTDRTATAITAGRYSTCAILDNGSVKCWGLNNNGQLGQNSTTWLGDDANEMGDNLLPVYLGSGRTAKKIVANNDSVCAILDNDTLKCWGDNSYGQLGTGDTNTRGNDAGEMSTLGTVNLGTGQVPAQIAIGHYHACALLTSTNLKCWGGGFLGQLGRGSTLNYGSNSADMGDALPLVDFDGVTPTVTSSPAVTSTPAIATPPPITSSPIATSSPAITSTPIATNTPVDTDTPTPTDTATPTHTPSATSSPIATSSPTKTLTRSRTPTRSKTKTKTRTPTKSKTPTRTPVGYVSRVVAVASGHSHSCAILASSVVKCWGRNDYGQLGLGDTSDRGDGSGEMANALPAVDMGTGVLASKMYAGSSHSCVLTTTNRVKCWGNNSEGQLGLGDSDHRGDGSSEMGDTLPYVDLGTGRTATALALGEGSTCALLDNATLVCWGFNMFGQLGIGSADTIGDLASEMGNALVPVDVGTGRTVKSISARALGYCALLDDDSIKCWGNNWDGQLGVGDTDHRGDETGEMGDNLTRVPFSTTLTPVELASVAYATCARFDDGTVRCWGSNVYGQLGTGDALNRGDSTGEVAALTAIDLGSGHTAKSIHGGLSYSFCAILDDDSLKCWGNNADANLGIGVGATDTNWGNATGEMGDTLPAIDLGTNVTIGAVSIGNAFRCAIVKPSTALKCWGANAYGQLGLGTTEASWGEYPDASMGDFLPYVRLGSIIPSTSTPTPTKSKTPTKTLSPSRTKSPTKTFTPSRTATRTPTP
jgi:alpha-tubulin suppressor-like RCC1 family protein